MAVNHELGWTLIIIIKTSTNVLYRVAQ